MSKETESILQAQVAQVRDAYLQLFIDRVHAKLEAVNDELKSADEVSDPRIPRVYQKAFLQGLLTAVNSQNLTIEQAQELVRNEIRRHDYRKHVDCEFLIFLIDQLLPRRASNRGRPQ